MREIEGLPIGIKIFTDFMSLEEAEMYIDAIESASNTECGAAWDIPETHSPDISFLRGNVGINISSHGFMNKDCNCGIKELDSVFGKTMINVLNKYNNDYSIYFTQDEGFIFTKQEENHIDELVIDDNPFVNRILSYHMALNVDGSTKYMRFEHLDFDITITKPSIVVFPSNFIYCYSKPYNDGLYEVINFFNNNPTDEVFDQAFEIQEV